MAIDTTLPPASWYTSACGTQTPGQCSMDLTMAAVPPLLLAGAAAVGAYIMVQAGLAKHEQRNWALDVREQQQAASNRFQNTSAMILLGGIAATVFAVFKLTAIAAATSVIATALSGVWLGVGTAIALNYIVHNRAYGDDGHKAKV